MFKIIKFTPVALTVAATIFTVAVAKAETPGDQKPSPTPTAKPQNQSIINTTKSNVKDHTVAVTPTSTPTAKAQNQSIINTTKSNTKDYRAAASPTPKSRNQTQSDKGWDGKVQGKHLKATPTPSPTPPKSR